MAPPKLRLSLHKISTKIISGSLPVSLIPTPFFLPHKIFTRNNKWLTHSLTPLNRTTSQKVKQDFFFLVFTKKKGPPRPFQFSRSGLRGNEGEGGRRKGFLNRGKRELSTTDRSEPASSSSKDTFKGAMNAGTQDCYVEGDAQGGKVGMMLWMCVEWWVKVIKIGLLCWI